MITSLMFTMHTSMHVKHFMVVELLTDDVERDVGVTLATRWPLIKPSPDDRHLAGDV